MWNTDTVWFDISLVTGLTAFGQIFFGHFELHTPKWRKVVKQVMILCLIVSVSYLFGQAWSTAIIAFMLLMVIVIHGIVLPMKGINGWTGEPKEKYYKFRGWDKYL